jgi:hypothetical protein
MVVVEFHNNTVTTIIGNINSPNATRTGLLFGGDNNGSALFSWIGNITVGVGGFAIDVGGVFTTARFDGVFKSSHTAVINIPAASCTLTVNGQIYNLVGFPGIVKTVSDAAGSRLIIDQCKIITNVANAITAPLLDQIKVIHSLACNFDTLPTIAAINMVVGSIAYFNVNVE